MDGFRVVKLNEVVRSIDILITCTGRHLSYIKIYLIQVKISSILYKYFRSYTLKINCLHFIIDVFGKGQHWKQMTLIFQVKCIVSYLL